MSHFLNLVLVPNATENVKMALEYLLEPYNEELEVAEYQRQCFCVRRGAFQKAEEEAASSFGSTKQLREQFAAEYVQPEGLDEEESYWHREQAWTEFIRDSMEFCEDRQRELLTSIKPDPGCEDCSGTGVVTTVYNPDSKWDWWQIGGRWTGVLTDYDPEADPRNVETCSSCGGKGYRVNSKDGSVGACHMCDGIGKSCKWPTEWADYDGDIMPVPDIHLKGYPHALVTPDGAWHQQGEMGFFGFSSCDVDDAEWKEVVDALLEKHHDCVAVVVDCHI